jgi:prepilin-type N-terminal cleavage/methylation domain-containing protein
MMTGLRLYEDPQTDRLGAVSYRVNLRRGFTLVEMLATVAIIAILAMVFLPYLTTGKIKAKDVRRIMNLRQLGLAQRLYASDFHDRFVYSGHGWWVTPLLECYLKPVMHRKPWLTGNIGGAIIPP